MNEVPEFLKLRLTQNYGQDIAEKIMTGYAAARPVTLRANSLKTTSAAVKEFLRKEGIDFLEVPWYEDALMIPDAREDRLRATALYERGEIYLQSLSSMLPPLYLEAKEGENVLDMTAAPGGKTTQISALTGGRAFLTACERDKIRAERLRYNVGKQGAPRVTVLCEDAANLSDFFSFDRILLDAPCSGSGTLDLNAPLKISEKLIQNCINLQKKLLYKAIKLLKKGGTLIYSTCSVLREENEGAVESVLGKGVSLLPLKPPPCVPLLPSLNGTLCVCPNETYEGFFIAKLCKL